VILINRIIADFRQIYFSRSISSASATTSSRSNSGDEAPLRQTRLPALSLAKISH
jgi:hypothetical protein